MNEREALRAALLAQGWKRAAYSVCDKYGNYTEEWTKADEGHVSIIWPLRTPKPKHKS